MAEGAREQFQEGDFLKVDGVVCDNMEYETVRGKLKTVPGIDTVTVLKLN